MNLNSSQDIVSQAAIVILAAGSSSRLGRPKQLLPYKGKSLIQQVAATALAATLGPVVVVTGAYETSLRQELTGMDLQLAHNPHWQEGLAGSLNTGLKAAQQIEAIDGVLFMVCDQPYVSPQLLQKMIHTQHATRKPVVACRYGEETGIPVLWHKKFFDVLYALQGDAGAKKLIRKYADEVATVDFPEGIFDIDTEADYARL